MPIAATLAESSGGCTGTPKEAMEKPAEAITCWILLDNVSVRSATRAHWDKAERVQTVGTTPQQKGVIHKTLERKHSDQLAFRSG